LTKSGRRMALTKAIAVAAQRVGGGKKLDFDEWVGYSATMFLGKACRGPHAPVWRTGSRGDAVEAVIGGKFGRAAMVEEEASALFVLARGRKRRMCWHHGAWYKGERRGGDRGAERRSVAGTMALHMAAVR
jgi:hypothetical protein